jgi:hypothetical protein
VRPAAGNRTIYNQHYGEIALGCTPPFRIPWNAS